MSDRRRAPGISIMPSGLYRILGPGLQHTIEVARIADAAGVDELLLGDHVVMSDRTDRYPYGPFAWPSEGVYDDPTTAPAGEKISPAEPAWPEPLTVLAALAAATTRLRLGPGILLVPLRPATLLAKTVATLDVLSGGRVELGVGVGWQPEEYAAQGLRFGDRWQHLEDTLRACRALWEQVPPVSFASQTVSFERAYCMPQPLQRRLPIFFGARATPALARRIAELGDGWFPLAARSREEVAAGATLIKEALRAAGRDPASLAIRVPLTVRRNRSGTIDGPATMAAVPALVEAGASMLWVVVGPHLGLRSMREVGAFIEDIAALKRM
ncbi:MAG: TIGR03619 family F420-dependent LLM class oxidoreductase [Candidatus Binatia bacterium]